MRPATGAPLLADAGCLSSGSHPPQDLHGLGALLVQHVGRAHGFEGPHNRGEGPTLSEGAARLIYAAVEGRLLQLVSLALKLSRRSTRVSGRGVLCVSDIKEAMKILNFKPVLGYAGVSCCRYMALPRPLSGSRLLRRQKARPPDPLLLLREQQHQLNEKLHHRLQQHMQREQKREHPQQSQEEDDLHEQQLFLTSVSEALEAAMEERAGIDSGRAFNRTLGVLRSIFAIEPLLPFLGQLFATQLPAYQHLPHRATLLLQLGHAVVGSLAVTEAEIGDGGADRNPATRREQRLRLSLPPLSLSCLRHLVLHCLGTLGAAETLTVFNRISSPSSWLRLWVVQISSKLDAAVTELTEQLTESPLYPSEDASIALGHIFAILGDADDGYRDAYCPIVAAALRRADRAVAAATTAHAAATCCTGWPEGMPQQQQKPRQRLKQKDVTDFVARIIKLLAKVKQQVQEQRNPQQREDWQQEQQRLRALSGQSSLEDFTKDSGLVLLEMVL
ncbi:hypothetical protein cyc_01383 [Cyclospora cayetanensis]|uniref:Uncharacterized protein n=1 Tax=Cyclospora cayetanensis TaxID=88456 RepID=A0A1D3CXX6_9EIME|nr:hypothetical protein cyc_01383 [Cyclospora cayetanensis]